MAKSIFLMSSESGAGKSIVALGVFAALQDHFKKIAYYKPIATLDSTTGKVRNFTAQLGKILLLSIVN